MINDPAYNIMMLFSALFTLFFLFAFPVIVIFILYKLIKKLIAYNAECKAKYNAQYNVQGQTFREQSKPLTQQSYEEWKAARKDTRGRD